MTDIEIDSGKVSVSFVLMIILLIVFLTDPLVTPAYYTHELIIFAFNCFVWFWIIFGVLLIILAILFIILALVK